MIDELILRLAHFKLFGHTVTVSKSPDLSTTEMEGNLCFGYSVDAMNLIVIQDPNHEPDISDSRLAETMIHEVVHQILDKTGYTRLSNDERFVGQFSKALHQVIKTAVFENEEV